VDIEQMKQLDKINKLHESVSSQSIQYWSKYSNMGTWHFWFLVGMLVIPLIILYFTIDRKKALLIGFYGLNVHLWFHYIDAYGVINALWNYPHTIIPFFSISIALETSFIPVTFMLLYQWTLNNKKNYYLYATGYCLFLAFLLKPALTIFQLFQLYKGNYFFIFLSYLSVSIISKWITNVFIHFEKMPQNPSQREISLKSLFLRKEKAR
jgi:hypothetical protein